MSLVLLRERQAESGSASDGAEHVLPEGSGGAVAARVDVRP